MINRDYYLNKLIPLINDSLIKVIMGMRRVGKSTLLLLIKEKLKTLGVLEEQFISINFELMKYDEYRDSDKLYEFINSKIINSDKYYIFLDEIQEVNNFERVINSINIECNVDIYITGSNSKLLSGELATYLTGRYYSIEVYPLSFEEIIGYKNKIDLDKDAEFLKYINYGGLPAVQRFNDQEDIIKGYINDMYSSIILKDIVKRYAIRDIDLLQRFLKFVFQNIGQIFSANSITNFMKNEGRKLSKETIYNYLESCKNAYIFHGVSRYDIKGKQLLKTKEKYFMNDLGIRSIFFNNQADISQILENIVYLELLKRGYKIFVGEFDIFEVDFIAEKDNEKKYIQVAYLMKNEKTKIREFSVLEKIDDNYPKYVISMDKVNMGTNGIIHLNIIDFLLSDKL